LFKILPPLTLPYKGGELLSLATFLGFLKTKCVKKEDKNLPPPFSKYSFMKPKTGLMYYSPTRKVVEVEF